MLLEMSNLPNQIPSAARRFDALLIDFYGTISAGDREAVERTCRRIVATFDIPMSAQQFAILWGERFFQTIEESNHDAFRTLFECETVSLSDMLREYVGNVDPAPFVADLEAYWRDPPLHDDVLEFFEGLNLPIGCVSNADTIPLKTAIAKHGLHFDVVVTSEDARCYKPDPAIFKRAVDMLGVDPRRVLHVGDSLHSDVNGAAKLGITTMWLRRADRIHDIGVADPHHMVSTLDAIKHFLL